MVPLVLGVTVSAQVQQQSHIRQNPSNSSSSSSSSSSNSNSNNSNSNSYSNNSHSAPTLLPAITTILQRKIWWLKIFLLKSCQATTRTSANPPYTNYYIKTLQPQMQENLNRDNLYPLTLILMMVIMEKLQWHHSPLLHHSQGRLRGTGIIMTRSALTVHQHLKTHQFHL